MLEVTIEKIIFNCFLIDLFVLFPTNKKVVILSVRGLLVRKFMLAAHDLGMTKGDWTFFDVEIFQVIQCLYNTIFCNRWRPLPYYRIPAFLFSILFTKSLDFSTLVYKTFCVSIKFFYRRRKKPMELNILEGSTFKLFIIIYQHGWMVKVILW